MCEKYLESDFRSLAMHKRIAELLIKDPSAVTQKALDNIERWKALNDFPQPYLDEWLVIIKQGPEILANFMTATTEEAQRLRSSSPFTGVLSKEERDAFFRKLD